MSNQINIDKIEIVECPRDAMQGILDFIPTALKIKYINSLMKVGFETLDCGSFVSPSAIPQMKDTKEVLEKIKFGSKKTKISVIIANDRGAVEACEIDIVNYIGFPFSISEQFQYRNTKKTIADALVLTDDILNIATKKNKEVVIYLSMGFGNPYGEPWDPELVSLMVEKLYQQGHRIFSISDTIGISNEASIKRVYRLLSESFTDASFGCHFHTKPDEWKEKIEAATASGCTRFDGALKGFGGCPMAKDDLVGNMPTERLLEYFAADRLNLDVSSFNESMKIALKVFNQ
jgi:hydroxymethylglutaryl-CoA lyase